MSVLLLRNSLLADIETINGLRDGCATAMSYTTIQEEYECVRARVGLQDLSHYGKISVSGDQSLDLINHLIMTDLARLPINQLQSSYMLDDAGKPVCELLIANLGSRYLLLTEGTEPASVEARLRAALADFPDCEIVNDSASTALLSVDGPYSWELLKTFLGLGIIGTRYLEVVPEQMVAGVETMLCRAGKTGEYGYLLIAAAKDVVTLWNGLKAAGERFGLLPIGYAAVDICKMENRNVSQHHEGWQVGNVLELNTRTMLSRDKGEHVGRAALMQVIDQGVERRLVGVTFPPGSPSDSGDIGSGAMLSHGTRPVGMLVNSGYSYALKRMIGLALMDDSFACAGLDFELRTEQRTHVASTVSAPFLFNKSLTIRPQEDSYFAS